MLDLLLDLLLDLIPGRRRDVRVRRLRRKLVRFLKNAPSSAFLGTEEKHLDAQGEIRGEVRRRVVSVAKSFECDGAADWGDLCARFFDALEKSAPGVTAQVPPDEPRMVYAGEKPL